MSTVSVVIAAFDAEGFLRRAVASALAEDPLEIVIVDDASRDGTLALAQTLALEDARVRVIALAENAGPSKARNAGFAAALGDWIAVLDADDAFEPGRLRRLLAAAADADIVADNVGIYDQGAGRVVSLGVEGAQRRTIDIYDYVGASRGAHGDMDWGLLKPMFRRAFLEAHGLAYPEQLRHGEDFVFVFRILLAGGRFVFTPELGYLHTQRVGPVSGASSGMSRTRIAYDAMARDARQLMQQPAVRADRRLLALMRLRYRGIRELEARHQAPYYVGERRFGALLRLLARNPAALAAVVKILLRRVRRSSRPSDQAPADS